MRVLFTPGLVTVALGLLMTGCASDLSSPSREEPVVKVMALLQQCGLSDPAIHGLDGSGEAFSTELQQELEDIVLPEGRQAVVVAMGQQETAGYGLSMLDARWFGDATLNLSMQAENPTKDRVAAQVITEPCVILDVPAEGWTQLRVNADLIGFPVAWVRDIR
ncbi:MAG: hypothetical protein CL583_03760 [Alteromonadaceae bacterium]|nr:hypothetical protein [Alteromonadaceae bacterium]